MAGSDEVTGAKLTPSLPIPIFVHALLRRAAPVDEVSSLTGWLKKPE
jgi:hypothetical protein